MTPPSNLGFAIQPQAIITPTQATIPNFPPWHILLPVMFAIGLTVYVVSEINPHGGWLYVLILLLGIALAYKSFAPELNHLLKPPDATVRAPRSGVVAA